MKRPNFIGWLTISTTLASRFSHDDYRNISPYTEVELDHAPTCEQISIPMCEGIGYNYTSMELSPFHHKSQQESGLEAHQFYPLVQLECSEDLRPFLCGLYTPVCMEDYPKFLPPCRFLCERARAGCEPLMRRYGFSWPEKMDCSLLPDVEPCNHFNRPWTIETPPTPIKIPHNTMQPTQFYGQSIPTCQNCQCSDEFVNLNRRFGAEHEMFAINSWKIGGQTGCAMPCKSPYINDHQRTFLNGWILLFSVSAIISTLIVQFTFLIDMNRFKYPERPIVYLSLCYLFISIGYLIRFFVNEDGIACDSTDKNRLTNNSSIASIHCQIVFVLVYYFGMASSIWWVMLTFAWFLAAGMKWSSEAIGSYSSYMHLISWILPAVKTIIIISTSSVDGDPFLGVCGVGNTNINNLHIFILAPLVVYLSAGCLFLIVGFVSLLRIRRTIKAQDETRQAKKLEKLIVKIFVFSVLYMIPAGVRIACYFYESEFRHKWEYYLNCSDCGSKFTHFSYYVILIRTFMELVVGITSFTWILGSKTLKSWRKTGICWTSLKGDGNTTISTTSTMTTHDNWAAQPTQSVGGSDRDQRAEFHYQYYNNAQSKPLL